MDFYSMNRKQLKLLKDYIENVIDFVNLQNSFAIEGLNAIVSDEFTTGTESVLKVLKGDLSTIEELLEDVE